MNKVQGSHIRFRIAQTKKEILQAKRLCHDVYLQEKYIPKAYPDGIIPFANEKNAVYIIAVNVAGDVVGTLRLFKGPGFRTFKAWQGEILPEAKAMLSGENRQAMAEVGALAVNPAWQNHEIARGMFRTGLIWLLKNNYRYVIISVDTRVLRLLKMFGWEIISIGKPKFYMGSLTAPGLISLRRHARLRSQPEAEVQNKAA
jgi:N-acyl-L-homoserine lactone synthetase